MESDETFGAKQTEEYEIVKSVTPSIIEKVKEEETIANLRADFCEQQQKRLNEAVEVGPSAKKQKIGNKKGSSSKLNVPHFSTLIPPSLLVLKANDVESILFHGQRETVTISGNDSLPNTQPFAIAHVDVPSREELEVFLERFCTFTNMEPPTSHMNELFPVLKRIPVDVTTDPHRTSWLCSTWEHTQDH